jgi:hypothetical protein
MIYDSDGFCNLYVFYNERIILMLYVKYIYEPFGFEFILSYSEFTDLLYKISDEINKSSQYKYIANV